AFITAVQINGFDLDETVYMTKSLIEDGERIEFEEKTILDKHSVGGTNGRTTMIIVPIIAAAGYLMPKTSSRSITSAAGTADSMEVLAPVTLTLQQIKNATKKAGGVIAWGGAVNLAPADDKIVKIEHPLSLDPHGQVIASVMAKKASVGAKFLVIDIPVGPDVKIKTKETAQDIALKFLEVGKELGIKVEVVLTDGSKPIGNTFGPALEAKLAMQVLEGKVFDELAKKSLELSGSLLELVGDCKHGEGYDKAKRILQSGAALKKMQEIIRTQGGNIFSSDQIKEARLKRSFYSDSSGTIKRINVKNCIAIARNAGAPADKEAGMLVNAMAGDMITPGQPLFEVHSNNKEKLASALRFAVGNPPVEMEKTVIEKFH
ncbi:MAG: thymidine phosphorylase, partial [Patescibacteria group bacterium]